MEITIDASGLFVYIKGMDESIKAYLARIGKKGGCSGKGASKVRGNKDYYKRIRLLSSGNKKKEGADGNKNNS